MLFKKHRYKNDLVLVIVLPVYTYKYLAANQTLHQTWYTITFQNGSLNSVLMKYIESYNFMYTFILLNVVVSQIHHLCEKCYYLQTLKNLQTKVTK